MTWSILARDPATGALGRRGRDAVLRGRRTGDPCRGRGGGAGDPGADQPDVCGARDAAAACRRGARCGDRCAAGGGCRAGASADPHAGRGRPDRARIPVRTASAGAGRCAGTDVSVAGNMLAGPDVVARHWRRSKPPPGSMAERLLTALEAGEAAGGDKRGKQSAAMKVCTRDPYPDLDIRADDHPDPLAEMRRLHARQPGAVRGVPPFPAGRRQPMRGVRPGR